ncbi:MFS transporter [Demequina sp. NBRC 110052]|uniref:MFS transporter n=1 Tax=Demequina sp. NBRC 110052 TaxID=1570341 RepID=UPI000A03B421|nr:MFS transporter [Demequina sp. NBRC 110052]
MTDAAARPGRDSLGPAFARLWGAAIATNLGDGLARVAVPLVAVSLTRDPLAVAVLGGLAVLPWLLFGIYAGVIVDRSDRRRVLAFANVLRFATVAVVVVALATGWVSLWLLAVATLLFGVGEVLADNATNAIMPAVVRRDQLDRANGRIQAAQVGVDMFVATPLAGVLFAIAAVVPLLAAGGSFAAVVVLALSLPAAAARAQRRSVPVEPEGLDAPTPLVVVPSADPADAVAGGGVDLAEPRVGAKEGFVFLWRHRWLRSMVLFTSIIAALLTFAQASTILLFLDTFGVPEAAIGVVTAGIGLGGLGGALFAPALVARLGRGRTMLLGTLLGGVGLLATGLAPHVAVAIAAYAVGAFGVGTWNVPWGAARQALIPPHLLGRVLGLGRTIGWGLIPVASLIGGLVARTSLTLPLVVGGAAVTVMGVLGARLILDVDRQEPADYDDEELGEDSEDGAVAEERVVPSPAS